MRKVVAGGSPNPHVKSNIEKDVDDTDIVLVSSYSVKDVKRFFAFQPNQTTSF